MQQVTIEKLISNGRGLARANDGRVLFIEGALPGETWEIEEIVKRRGSYWASGTRLTDAPIRMEPTCPHFGGCGGCALLHIHPRFELNTKIEFLHDVLARVGGVRDVALEAVDFPPSQSRIRGKLHADQAGNLGFHQEGANKVTPIHSCHVLPQGLVAILPKLTQAIKASRFEGEIYFMTDIHGKDPRLELVGSIRVGGTDPQIWKDSGAAGLLLRGWDHLRLVEVGNLLTRFQWGAIRVQLPPTAFLQSNPAAWPVFGHKVKSWLDQWQPHRVWDMHAGAGFLCSFLRGVEIFASEPERASFDQLREGLKVQGSTHGVFQGTAEAALKRDFFVPRPDDGLLLDPPREGLSNILRQWIVDHGPNSLLYFSCDIASFARDLRHLQEAYRLQEPLLVMNVNPGTLRLELGAVLVRN